MECAFVGAAGAERKGDPFPLQPSRHRIEIIGALAWFRAPSPLAGEGVTRSVTALNLADLRAAREDCAMTDVPVSVLRSFAREQRANAVQAEAIIWRAVRDRRCEGAKFRRQVALGNFIVDFVCFDRRFAVEIDGPTHESAEQQAKDGNRDAWLLEQGFRVLRLPNELVIASTELAVTRIRAALGG